MLTVEVAQFQRPSGLMTSALIEGYAGALAVLILPSDGRDARHWSQKTRIGGYLCLGLGLQLQDQGEVFVISFRGLAIGPDDLRS